MADAGKITAIIDGDISGLTSALNQAEQKATASIAGIEGGFKNKLGAGISDSMSGMAASMGPVGGALSAIGPAGIAAGAAIAGVGMALSSSVNVAAQFQQTMSGVAAVAGATAPELEAMSTAAREAGASSVFSASQAAEAMGFLASSGMSVSDTIATLNPTLTMAAAGGMGLAEAGDLMAGSLAQFGLSAGSATSVADTLAAGAAASNASITQLGQGLQNVGPMAANVGMSLQETTAALGVFANSNIKGAEAGTALKSMLASLLEPTKGAAAALAEMGLSANDVNPSLNSYDEIMSKLKDSGMSAQQAVAIFGKEMASNAMVAVNGADSYDKLLEKVKETGKASEMAKTQTDNYKGAMDEFNGAIEEAQITLGNVFLPILTDVTQALTVGVTAAIDFGKGLGDAWSSITSGDASSDIGKMLSGDLLGGMEGLLGYDIDDYRTNVSESTEEGMVEGTDAAQDDIQGSVEEAVGEGAKDAFKNVSPELASIMQGFGVGDAAALAIMNAQTRRVQDDRNSAGVTSTTLENGLRVDLKYQTDDGMTRATLLVNGQEIAGPVYGWGIEKTLPELFQQAGLGYNQGNVLDLTGKLGDSAIWAASQTTDLVLDSFLDVTSSTKGEIKAAGEEIAEAFAAGMVPDKATIDAHLADLRNLQLYDPEEAKAQGSQNAINYLTAIKEAIESYDEAKAKYLVEPDNERARADLERARANLQAQLDANPLKATVTTTWGQFDTKSFAELIMDPEAVKNAALDINKFFDGTIVPGIRGGMENARSAFEQGQITQGMVYDNLIKPLEQYADYLPGWLEEMNAMFKSGQIGIEDYIWLLDQMTGKASAALDKTSEKLKSQSVGWDALKDTIGECTDCAISDFARWQESQDGLFQDSYIGQGGQQYLDWKTEQINAIAETQAAMRAVGGTVLGQDYTQSPLLSVGVDADTTLAESKLEGLKSTITDSQPIMKVDLDTTIADTKFMNLFQTIQNARPVMNVDINPLIDLGGIIGMIESALRSAGL